MCCCLLCIAVVGCIHVVLHEHEVRPVPNIAEVSFRCRPACYDIDTVLHYFMQVCASSRGVIRSELFLIVSLMRWHATAEAAVDPGFRQLSDILETRLPT